MSYIKLLHLEEKKIGGKEANVKRSTKSVLSESKIFERKKKLPKWASRRH